MSNQNKKINIELNRSFLNWCLKNNLSVKENPEIFFVNERFLIKPEYIINGKVFVDILKNGDYNKANVDNYKNFAQGFGTLILIKEEHIWLLDNITKGDLEETHKFSF
jgi:hypothetical protein